MTLSSAVVNIAHRASAELSKGDVYLQAEVGARGEGAAPPNAGGSRHNRPASREYAGAGRRRQYF